MKTMSCWTGCAVLCLGCASVGEASADTSSSNSLSVYGRLGVTVEQASSSGAPVNRSVRRVSSGRSVLGFKGEETLGDGCHVLFQIEGALLLDTGVATSIANRDTRIGADGPWGTAFAGQWVLPYLSSTVSYDPFYATTAAYTGLMSNGTASSASNISDTSSFDRRQQNSLHYWTPSWKGLVGKFAYALNEGEVGPGGGHPHLWSSSVTYDSGNFNAALAHEEHMSYQGPGLKDLGTKLGVSYRAGGWRLSAVGEHLRYDTPTGALTRDSYFAALAWQMGSGSARLDYTKAMPGRGPMGVRIGSFSAGIGTGAAQITLGYDYSFSKRTGLFVFASRISNQAYAAYDFSINPVGVGAGEKPRVLAAGIRHAF